MNIETTINRDYVNYLNIMVNEIESEHLSVFAGAGISINSGFVDWKGLMRPIIDQLEISPDMDLSLAAQFYENEFGRHDINRLIFDEFNRKSSENEILKLLGLFPIKSYWTTNYDSLIEDTLSQPPILKTVDLKINKDQFKYHIPEHDVTVYKMHGDKRYPDEAIITKNDYEVYDTDREVFTKALFTELITNTFLFIGFSFSDPNLDRILSIVKHTFDSNAPKNHFCFMRAVCHTNYADEKQYIQDRNFQRLRIREMRRYGIQTILIDDFSQIQVCLKYIKARLEQRRVFISGAIVENIENESLQAEFVKQLAQRLVEQKYKIVTGFGQTIGNYLLIGACTNKSVNIAKNLHREIEIYPLVAGGEKTNEMRKELIASCGSLITLFGKREYSSIQDDLLNSDGMYQELKIAKEMNKTLLPVGCTGYTSKVLWEYVDQDESNMYANTRLYSCWKSLFTKPLCEFSSVIDAIVELVEYRNILEQDKLEAELLHGIGRYNVEPSFTPKVFLSFHYNSSYIFARKVRKLINQTGEYTATEEESVSQQANSNAILNWIDQKINDTFATFLFYDSSIFSSKYVLYEIYSSLFRKNTLIVICKKEELSLGQEELLKRYPLDETHTIFCTTEEVDSPRKISDLLKKAEVIHSSNAKYKLS